MHSSIENPVISRGDGLTLFYRMMVNNTEAAQNASDVVRKVELFEKAVEAGSYLVKYRTNDIGANFQYGILLRQIIDKGAFPLCDEKLAGILDGAENALKKVVGLTALLLDEDTIRRISRREASEDEGRVFWTHQNTAAHLASNYFNKFQFHADKGELDKAGIEIARVYEMVRFMGAAEPGMYGSIRVGVQALRAHIEKGNDDLGRFKPLISKLMARDPPSEVSWPFAIHHCSYVPQPHFLPRVSTATHINH